MNVKPENKPELVQQIEKLKKINAALMARVERVHEGEPSAFALFENAATVERQVRHQTEDLRQALLVLEHSNDALQQAKQMAEAANSLKTTFLAAVSHDLLQPLHAARLTLSVLNERMTASADGALLDQADRSLGTLEEIIKTLLDLSKLDAGVSKPDMRGVAIDGLIDDLFAEFAPAAERRGLILRRRGSVVPVHTDALMLRRILQNLVSNAIRYTRQGGVLLCIHADETVLNIDIADTGPGIHHNRRAAIFEEFQRDDPGISEEPGFGLGLAIVRRFAIAMGHELKLWSRPGFGSVFSIRVPRLPEGSALMSQSERPLPAPFADVQILLATADESLLDAVQLLLKSWGCEIAVAASRETASAYLQNAERAPDLLITDSKQMIVQLRSEAEFCIPAVLIGISDEALDDRHNLEILQLPIKPAELRSLIAHFLQQTG